MNGVNSSSVSLSFESSIAQLVNDDVLFRLGTDSDQVLLNRSAILNANTALVSVLIGTPVTPALAANSLIIANTTADGDILIVGNDGGHSRTALFFDASTPDTYLYNVGGTWTAGATTWTIPAVTLGAASNFNSVEISNAIFLDAVKVKTGGNSIFIGSSTAIYCQENRGTYLLCNIDVGGTDAAAHSITLALDSIDFAALKATGNGAGTITNPYFLIGIDSIVIATNAVADMLVLQAGAGTNNEAANFGLGVAFNLGNAASEVEKRAYINLVLTDATNASEDVEMNFGLQIAGAASAEILSIVGGGLDLASTKVLSVAGVQVVGARVVDERADDVVDATYGAEEAGVIDALRDAMIAHGLIAAA